MVCRGIVDLCRGVPQLVWLILLYYGVAVGDGRFSALPAGVPGIMASGYLAEIFRGP